MTNADIIERYLAAVAAQLPLDQREDITDELRDLILSRIEAKEETLARAATDSEKEDILRDLGHPLVVAARYRKGPDSLIGPELFPYWLFGMKAGLIILAVAFALSLVLRTLTGSEHLGQSMGQALQGYFGAALTLTGMLTLIGAVMEHQNIRPRWLTHWRVSDLGAFNFTDPAAWNVTLGQGEEAASKSPRAKVRSSWPGSEHVFGLLFSGLFVMWWLGLIHFPGLGHVEMRGMDATLAGAPIWTTLFVPILLYAVGQGLVHLIGLALPGARRLVWALEMAANAFGLWLMWRVWQAGDWFTLTRGGETAQIQSPGYLPSWHALERLRETSDRGLEVWAQNLSIMITWGLAVGSLILIGEILNRLWRIARH
ncbi:MAG: hypothetical protein HZY74_11445 [Brevundimonas sp.]|nr:MAG: hypothetical protein HZY74_11445 [Brevundimonas sp.]